MRSRIAILAALVIFAGFSLILMGMWSCRMSLTTDMVQIERAEYFMHVWTIAFIITSVATVFVLIKIILEKRRQYDGDIE